MAHLQIVGTHIKEAWISGVIGTAVFRMNNGLFYIITMADDKPKNSVNLRELHNIKIINDKIISLSGPHPTIKIESKNISIEQINERLISELRKNDAFIMFLAGIDENASNETKKMCIERAEELSANNLIYDFLKTRIEKIGPPHKTTIEIVENAINMAEKMNLHKVKKLYRIMLSKFKK